MVGAPMTSYAEGLAHATPKICGGILLAALGLLGCADQTTHPACGLSDDQRGTFVEIPAGSFRMAAQPMYPEEAQSRDVNVDGFLLQIHEVTNDEFSKFIAATGYRTTAERQGESALFSPALAETATHPGQWWQRSKHATWWTPDGPGSDLRGRGNHPVVHVSWQDAQAYARWANARLLTEPEWEYAAVLGLFEPDRTDSGAVGPHGESRANIWNGAFPHENTGEDGFAGRAPVGCFSSSTLGAYDMIGNVWEWTQTLFDTTRYTIKGGSFLCSTEYCHRYRPAARQGMEADFSASHIGIRLARDLPGRTPHHSKDNE